MAANLETTPEPSPEAVAAMERGIADYEAGKSLDDCPYTHELYAFLWRWSWMSFKECEELASRKCN